jgi:hypothetical protein
MMGLVASGLTAFPLVSESRVLRELAGPGTAVGAAFPALAEWIRQTNVGLMETGERFPFIAYGTDWLAFGHIVIAIAFIGPFRDSVRNIWVIDFGLIACILVVPLALTCGHFRGIPMFWQLIDCSFGALGAIPLLIARRLTKNLETMRQVGETAHDT